jgi:arylsulfatase A-like enzyme
MLTAALRTLALGLLVAGIAVLGAASSRSLERPPSSAYRRVLVGGALTRLGPRPSRTLELDGERRPLLVPVRRHVFEAKLEEGCTVYLGAANAGEAGTVGAGPGTEVASTVLPTFLVSFLSAGDTAGEPVRIELPHERTWQDVALPVPAGGADGLVLSVEGADAEVGAWSRPLVACPIDDDVPPPVNVILVSLDTLRADRLGTYGNQRGLTPNLDRFAREGVAFTNAYSQYPNTLASHATVFTGYYPAQHQLTGAEEQRLPDDADTLAAGFARAGYVTAAFTEDAFVSSDFGFSVGFDRYDDDTDLHAGISFPGLAKETFQRGIDWLEERPQAPFFLFLHTYQVHNPYTPSPDALRRVLDPEDRSYTGPFAQRFLGLQQIAYNRGELPLSAADLHRIERLYDAETVELDDAVGMLLDAIDRLDLRTTTLVVFFADHGEEFGKHGHLGHGQSLHREELHVPWLMRLAGVVPEGERIEHPVGLIDMGPTVAGLAGIGSVLTLAPARSLVATVRNGQRPTRETIFSELINSARTCDYSEDKSLRGCPYGGVAVREGRYSYIEAIATGEESLFDLGDDPDELHDVAGRRPQLVARFRRLVSDYRDFVATAPMEGVRAKVEQATLAKLRALGYLD